MRIREGDPLEIFVSNEGEVIFKKYSPISELGSIAAQYCEVLYRTAGYPVLITDRDHVVAVSGISRREVLERRVSPGLEDHIENRKSYMAGDGQPLQPYRGSSVLRTGAGSYHLLRGCMRQCDVPAKQGE